MTDDEGATLLLTLDCHRDDEGRIRGELSWNDGTQSASFCGNLELLRVIEDHGPKRQPIKSELVTDRLTPDDKEKSEGSTR